MELPHIGVAFSGIHCAIKSSSFLFHFGFGQPRFAYALRQPRATVGGGVPFVHAVEQFVALVDDINFGLRQDVQIGVGDNHGDFDNAFAFGVKPGHFHIEPAEVVCVLGHFRRLCVFSWQYYKG